MSLPSCLTLRTIKGSALSWAELDTNFVCLNNLIDAKNGVGGNMWHIPSGDTITITTDYQYFLYGDIFIEGTLELMSGSQLVVLNGDIILSGTGAITGPGDIYNIDLPEFDTKVSGMTYSGNVLTLIQTDGSKVYVTIPQFTGNTSGNCITNLYVNNLNSCSPLHIQPNPNGNVLIGENGGVNVGINTSSPTAKLQIVGLDSSSSNYGLKVQNSGGTDNFVVRNDGYSAFLPSGPVKDIYFGDSARISTSLGGNGTLKQFDLFNCRLSNTFYGDNNEITNVKYISMGYALIDTDVRLKIVGSDSSSSKYGLKVQNSGGTNNLVVRNDGNVGIGTSNPNAKLDVVGNMTVSGTSPTNVRVRIGSGTAHLGDVHGANLAAVNNNGNSNIEVSTDLTGGTASLSLSTSSVNQVGITKFGPNYAGSLDGILIANSLYIRNTAYSAYGTVLFPNQHHYFIGESYADTYIGEYGIRHSSKSTITSGPNGEIQFYKAAGSNDSNGFSRRTMVIGDHTNVGGTSGIGDLLTIENNATYTASTYQYRSGAVVHINDMTPYTAVTGNIFKVTKSNVEVLSLSASGNLGVNQSNPSEKLEVNGRTKTTNFQMTSGATPSYVLTSTDSNGNAKWSPVSGITGVGNVTKYTTTLTFTDGETKTITHNLNTKFVHCSVWDTSTNELITPQVARVSGSEITSVNITIATAGNYDILITG